LANTLQVLIANHRDFISALELGKVLRGKALEAWGEADDDVLVDEIVAAFEEDGDEPTDIGNYHGAELLADVRHDLELLMELQTIAESVASGRDPKADRLIEELVEVARAAGRPSRDGDLTEADRRKVIVFSTFADTIVDLHQRVIAAIGV